MTDTYHTVLTCRDNRRWYAVWLTRSDDTWEVRGLYLPGRIAYVRYLWFWEWNWPRSVRYRSRNFRNAYNKFYKLSSRRGYNQGSIYKSIYVDGKLSHTTEMCNETHESN